MKILRMVHRRTWPKTLIHCFNFVPNFCCRSFKNLFFFYVKTCCKILFCNSIAIVHYFWKTKILNLKNFASFWQIFLHDAPLKSSNFMFYHWKAWILRSIFLSVARQPDKHMLKYHAHKLRCHLRVHCPLPTCQSQGALRLNELATWLKLTTI
jgi:hypothetical protein